MTSVPVGGATGPAGEPWPTPVPSSTVALSMSHHHRHTNVLVEGARDRLWEDDIEDVARFVQAARHGGRPLGAV